MTYDPNNIFAKIVRGEIPSTCVYEDDYALCIKNINPEAEIHLLVLTKGQYTDFQDFHKNAPAAEIVGFNKAVTKMIAFEDLDKTGYRLITNCRGHSGQEIPHLHYHILGGEPLGKII